MVFGINHWKTKTLVLFYQGRLFPNFRETATTHFRFKCMRLFVQAWRCVLAVPTEPHVYKLKEGRKKAVVLHSLSYPQLSHSSRLSTAAHFCGKQVIPSVDPNQTNQSNIQYTFRFHHQTTLKSQSVKSVIVFPDRPKESLEVKKRKSSTTLISQLSCKRSPLST